MNNAVNFLKIVGVTSFLLFTLTSCWSSHEINDIAVIDVMGIDKNEKGEYEITASIMKTNQIYSQTSKNSADDQGGSIFVVSTTGKSIVQAISRLSLSVPKRIYFGHLTILVLGHTFASEENLGPGLDFFRRENDFRPGVQLYVTKGKAKEIVSTKPKLEPTLGLEIKSRFITNRYASTAMVKDLSKFSEAISSRSSEPYTGVLVLPSSKMEQGQDEGDPINQEIGEMVTPDEGETVLGLNGTAVFKKGKLVGYLNNEETKGLLWLKGDLNEDILVIPCKNGVSNESISLIVRKVNTTISPQMEEALVKLNVDIHVDGEINEMTCTNPPVSSQDFEKLNRRFESIVNKEIDGFLKKIKNEWSTDIVGFGEQINRKYPKTWSKMASDWGENGFKDAVIKINTDFSITRSGLYKGSTSDNE